MDSSDIFFVLKAPECHRCPCTYCILSRASKPCARSCTCAASPSCKSCAVTMWTAYPSRSASRSIWRSTSITLKSLTTTQMTWLVLTKMTTTRLICEEAVKPDFAFQQTKRKTHTQLICLYCLTIIWFWPNQKQHNSCVKMVYNQSLLLTKPIAEKLIFEDIVLTRSWFWPYQKPVNSFVTRCLCWSNPEDSSIKT